MIFLPMVKTETAIKWRIIGVIVIVELVVLPVAFSSRNQTINAGGR